jgi:peptidoglycan/LPS O-acetylase OafA/YrhL
MFFYALFGTALLWPINTAVAVSAALSIVVLSGWFLGPLPLPLSFWGDPIVLEFVFGMIIAAARRRGMWLPEYVGVMLIASGVLLLIAWNPATSDTPRVVGWGLPAAAIVAGATLSAGSKYKFYLGRAFIALGDASYSLYLLHLMVLLAWRRAWSYMGWNAAEFPMLYAGTALLGSLAAAILVFVYFERPITRCLNERLRSIAG